MTPKGSYTWNLWAYKTIKRFTREIKFFMFNKDQRSEDEYYAKETMI